MIHFFSILRQIESSFYCIYSVTYTFVFISYRTTSVTYKYTHCHFCLV